MRELAAPSNVASTWSLARVLRLAVICGAVCSVVSLLGVSRARADDQKPDSFFPFLNEGVIQDFARMLKVDPNDVELRAMFNALKENLEEQPFGDLDNLPPVAPSRFSMRQNAPSPVDSRSLATMLPRVRVVKHYRFEGGVPFAEAQPEPVSEAWRQESRATSEYFQKAMMDALRLVQETPPLPDCEKDSAEKWELGGEDPEASRRLMQDFLYIRGEVPADARERFGSAVAVTPCGSEPGDACAIAKHITGATCVPTRFITQNGIVTRLEGSRALRKFEFSPEGVRVRSPKEETP